MSEHQRVAVLGSGASGLVAARTMRDAGHDVIVLEARPQLGGVWSPDRAYPGLATQNTKGAYSFSDLPMPEEWPQQPTGAQMSAYLERYADLHGLRPLIRFGTRVVSVRPGRSDTRWMVEAVGEDGAHQHLDVDAVVISTGVFNAPRVPELPGAAEFERAGGELVLPQQIDLEALRAKHVVVVGWGKTACDLAVAVQPHAASTTIVARSLRWKTPQPAPGLPLHTLMMLSRTGEWMLYPQRTRLPRAAYRVSRIPARLLRLLTAELISRQLDLQGLGMRPPGDLVEASSQVTRGLYEAIRSGEITVLQGSGVDALHGAAGPTLTLADGRSTPADLVAIATGYTPRLDFLDPRLVSELVDDDGELDLHRTIHSERAPGLYFVGWSGNISGLTTAEVAALWAAAHLADWPGLASSPRAPRQARTGEIPLRGVPMTMLRDLDEQLADLGGRLPRRVRLRQWYRSLDSADYRPILDAVRRRLDAQRPRTAPSGVAPRPGDAIASVGDEA